MPGPLLRVVWTDPVSGRHGFAVIDALVDGLAGGGTRVRPGCTLEEVERLARTMTLKTAAFELPVGGCKCGLDMDPQDPQVHEVLVRFVQALRPYFNAWMNTGEDMGTSQELLAAVFDEAGAGEPLGAAINRQKDPPAVRSRLAAGQGNVVDGVPLTDLVGGFGVAEAAATAMARLGIEAGSATAVVQGFGSMGGSSARYLARKGVRVVAVADAHGVVHDPGGLDVEAMIGQRSGYGDIDRDRLPAGVRHLPPQAWRRIECDALVPAAVADVIDEENAAELRCRVVVEAANLPTTPGGEAVLSLRGIPVVPDFVANAGTGSWLWWLVLGQIEPTPEAAFERVSAAMRGTVDRLFDRSPDGLALRQAAMELALANLRAIQAQASS